MNRDSQQRARRDLAAAYRLIAHLGMDDGIYTHISARLPGDSEHFLLNPYGLRFDEITADNLVSVDADGAVIDDPLGRGVNAAGFIIHSAIHAARADVGCVLHTHTVAGVAVACQERGLLPLNQWALQFHRRLAYHDYEGISLDRAERQRLVADLGDQPAMILRNHGLLTCGRNVGEAFLRMRDLERSCQAQLAAQASGAALRELDPALCDHVAGQYVQWAERDTADGDDPAWLAELRRLDTRP
ncbi:class II aldolase/adducin family protein [Modicisalibacter radicis]|uniref:class II aldolase/adducin family protein n=1 Tax=Halomonas sp. EAR18 TaxID=2518972 RepID=UPI00109C2402|nr:class II aldolase/adducin family protein [Halomonas sp. EAR18]